MARFKNGILGGFSGKIGDAVGFQLNGEWFGRSKPRKRTSPPSEKEVANRAKFAFSQAWLQPITAFVRIGFKNYSVKSQGFIAAKSYNSKNALVGNYPNFEIDPALALVSFGPLAQAEEASVTVETPMTISITWSGGDVGSMQKAMVLLYDIENGKSLMDQSAAWRQASRFDLPLPNSYRGNTYHVYLAFVSSDMEKQSNSQYLGAVTMQ